jgi:acyl-CoA synthetase (AMP-forming)/AMP-acid ligase II
MNIAELLQIPAEVMAQTTLIRMDQETCTYAGFAAATARLSQWLEDRQVGPGSIVSTSQMLSVPHLALMFATFNVGATFNPLNYRSRADDLGQLLTQARSSVVVVDDRYSDLVAECLPPGFGQLLRTSDLPLETTGAADLWPVEVDDDDLALLLFTSGTTGTPKPVKLRHSDLTTAILDSTNPPDGEPAGSTLVSVPTYHVAGLTTVLTSVFTGRCLVLLPQFDALSWVDAVAGAGVDHAFCVPTMLKQVVDHVESEKRQTALSSLTTLAYGAAPMPASVITRALAVFPAACGFVNAYGQTETLGTVTMLLPEDHRVGDPPDDGAALARRLSSVGRAIPGVEIAILDEAGAELAPMAIGQVAVRRPGVGQLDGGDGWHHTGDVGLLDDQGYLYLRGRLGDLIIRGGENIDPREIENVLEAHPSVAEAAVIGEPDDEWGEVIVAYAVPAPGCELNPEELRDHVRQHIASFKVPKEIHVTSELPRNSMGKILKRELRGSATND